MTSDEGARAAVDAEVEGWVDSRCAVWARFYRLQVVGAALAVPVFLLAAAVLRRWELFWVTAGVGPVMVLTAEAQRRAHRRKVQAWDAVKVGLRISTPHGAADDASPCGLRR